MQANEHVQTMLELVKEGWLDTWELGRKGTHISSRIACHESVDTLTSPDSNDRDYVSLTQAHIGRALQLIQQANPDRVRGFEVVA